MFCTNFESGGCYFMTFKKKNISWFIIAEKIE